MGRLTPLVHHAFRPLWCYCSGQHFQKCHVKGQEGGVFLRHAVHFCHALNPPPQPCRYDPSMSSDRPFPPPSICVAVCSSALNRYPRHRRYSSTFLFTRGVILSITETRKMCHRSAMVTGRSCIVVTIALPRQVSTEGSPWHSPRNCEKVKTNILRSDCSGVKMISQ